MSWGGVFGEFFLYFFLVGPFQRREEGGLFHDEEETTVTTVKMGGKGGALTCRGLGRGWQTTPRWEAAMQY